MLVWLKSIHHIEYKRIRADLPPPDAPLSTYVMKHQKSNKPSLLLGLQFVSLLHPLYCFQILLMHYPHQDQEVILPATSDANLPSQVIHFHRAIQCIPHMFESDTFCHMQEAEGHKNSYTTTALSHIQSLKDLLIADSLHVLPAASASLPVPVHTSSTILKGQQTCYVSYSQIIPCC